MPQLVGIAGHQSATPLAGLLGDANGPCPESSVLWEQRSHAISGQFYGDGEHPQKGETK